MKPLLISLFLIMVLSCKNEDKLTFEPVTYEEIECADCPLTLINIPRALETTKIANTINIAIQEELISQLTFDDTKEVASIKAAMESFKNGYLELKKMYPDETVAWEAKIDGEIVYENKNIITIALNSYLFSGGAHGYSSAIFLNFNKHKGVEFENGELFKKEEDFIAFAETKFRAQEKINLNEAINSTGFMFQGDTFYLPENIGFTQEGIQLLYNQYEVASYADGPIILTLPFSEVNKYLAVKIEL